MSFQVFEKHPTVDAYRFGAAYEPYAIIGVEKRLTDAELAAEYLFVVHGENTVLEWHYWDGNYRSPQSVSSQMFRFATLPHFDEATP